MLKFLFGALIILILSGCSSSTTIRNAPQAEIMVMNPKDGRLHRIGSRPKTLAELESYLGTLFQPEQYNRKSLKPKFGDLLLHGTDVVTIQVHTVFLQDFPLTLTGSKDVVIFAEVWDNAANGSEEATYNRIVYAGKRQQIPGRMNFTGHLAYGPLAYAGLPLKIKFTVMVLQQEEGETQGNAIDIVSSYAELIPTYGTFASEASGILSDILRAQPDVVAFDFQATLLSPHFTGRNVQLEIEESTNVPAKGASRAIAAVGSADPSANKQSAQDDFSLYLKIMRNDLVAPANRIWGVLNALNPGTPPETPPKFTNENIVTYAPGSTPEEIEANLASYLYGFIPQETNIPWLRYGFYGIVQTKDRDTSSITMKRPSVGTKQKTILRFSRDGHFRFLDGEENAYYFDGGFLTRDEPTPRRQNRGLSGLPGVNYDATLDHIYDGSYIIFTVTPGQRDQGANFLEEASRQQNLALTALRQSPENMQEQMTAIETSAGTLQQRFAEFRFRKAADEALKMHPKDYDAFLAEYNRRAQTISSGAQSDEHGKRITTAQNNVQEYYRGLYASIGNASAQNTPADDGSVQALQENTNKLTAVNDPIILDDSLNFADSLSVNDMLMRYKNINKHISDLDAAIQAVEAAMGDVDEIATGTASGKTAEELSVMADKKAKATEAHEAAEKALASAKDKLAKLKTQAGHYEKAIGGLRKQPAGTPPPAGS